jgi:hypothetical protein
MLSQIQDYLSLDAKQAISSPLLWYGLGIVFVLLLVWKLIRSSQPQLVSVFKDDEGAVQITPQALRELVRKSCADLPGVHSPSTKIFTKSNQVRLLVKLEVEPGSQVKLIRSQLNQKLEQVMVENLNFSNFGGIDIVIKGFQDAKA